MGGDLIHCENCGKKKRNVLNGAISLFYTFNVGLLAFMLTFFGLLLSGLLKQGEVSHAINKGYLQVTFVCGMNIYLVWVALNEEKIFCACGGKK